LSLRRTASALYLRCHSPAGQYGKEILKTQTMYPSSLAASFSVKTLIR
jgi:hypothetical protein